MPSNLYECFSHETCGSEDCAKIVKFREKTTSHRLCSGDVDDVQLWSIFAGDESRVYVYDIETKAQLSQCKRPEEPRPQKAHQVWSNVRICSLFSAIAMTWCIMNFFHKIVQSIRNTTLKLCVDCVKQFVRNAQNCGKTNRGICTMITYQLTHRCLCVSFWTKTKT